MINTGVRLLCTNNRKKQTWAWIFILSQEKWARAWSGYDPWACPVIWCTIRNYSCVGWGTNISQSESTRYSLFRQFPFFKLNRQSSLRGCISWSWNQQTGSKLWFSQEMKISYNILLRCGGSTILKCYISYKSTLLMQLQYRTVINISQKSAEEMDIRLQFGALE